MRATFIVALFITLTVPVHGQTQNPANIKGHLIGESIANFLRAEPEAQQEADVCRDHPLGSTCSRLVAALDRGGRAEISTSDGADFVLDAGMLVKVTMLVQGDSDETSAALTQKFGPMSNDKAIPNGSTSGTKWQNHLFSWSTPQIYASLFVDNNPLLENRAPVMVVETQAEHILEDADLAQKTRQLEAAQLKH